MILMQTMGGGVSASSFTNTVTLSKQEFIATEDQNIFIVTSFILTENFILVIDDLIQTSNYVKNDQNITLSNGLNEGSKVVVYGVSGTITGSTRKQEYTAVAGQTVFTVTAFILTDTFVFVMGGVIQASVYRDQNSIHFTPGASEGSKIIIYG